MRPKTYSFREFIKIVTKNGYTRDHTTGSHLMYKKGNDTIVVTNNRINKMIAQRLIKQHRLIV